MQPNSPRAVAAGHKGSINDKRRASKLSSKAHKRSDSGSNSHSKRGSSTALKEGSKISIGSLEKPKQNNNDFSVELNHNINLKTEERSKYYKDFRINTDHTESKENEGEEDEEEREERIRMEKLMHFIEIEVIKRMDLEKHRFVNAINQISKQCSDENSQVKEMNEYVSNLHLVFDQFQKKIETLVTEFQQKYTIDYKKIKSDCVNLEIKNEYLFEKLSKLDIQNLKEEDFSNISYNHNNLLNLSNDSKSKPSTAVHLRNISARRMLTNRDKSYQNDSSRFISSLKSKIKKKNMSNFVINELYNHRYDKVFNSTANNFKSIQTPQMVQDNFDSYLSIKALRSFDSRNEQSIQSHEKKAN